MDGAPHEGHPSPRDDPQRLSTVCTDVSEYQYYEFQAIDRPSTTVSARMPCRTRTGNSPPPAARRGPAALSLIAEPVVPTPGALVPSEDVLEPPEGAPPGDGDPEPVGEGDVAEPVDEQLHVPVAGPGTQSRHVQPSFGIVRLLGRGPSPQLVCERRPAFPGGQVDPATRLSQVALQQHGQHLQIDGKWAQQGNRRISHGRSQLVRQFLVAPEPALPEFTDARGRHLRSPRQALHRCPGHTIAGHLQNLRHSSTTQRGKQRRPVLSLERASHGSQPALVPALGHDSDGSAPPGTYCAGPRAFMSRWSCPGQRCRFGRSCRPCGAASGRAPWRVRVRRCARTLSTGSRETHRQIPDRRVCPRSRLRTDRPGRR